MRAGYWCDILSATKGKKHLLNRLKEVALHLKTQKDFRGERLGTVMKELFRLCGKVCILVALVQACIHSEAGAQEGVGDVWCQYRFHQNACAMANGLNVTIRARGDTKILRIGAVVTKPPSGPFTGGGAGKSVNINIPFPGGIPFCTQVTVSVKMTLSGTVCKNRQSIEKPVWDCGGGGGDVPMSGPVGGGWAVNARQRKGELDYHRFVLKNEDSTCCCIRNLKFHHGPLDLFGEELYNFDGWMPELYAGGDSVLCPSDSMVHDLVLPYQGYLPHIQGYYEIWECPTATQGEEPVARCWFSHYDYVTSDPGDEARVIYFETSPANLFSDAFPVEGDDMESYVRADMARNINPHSSDIRPGDSIVVRCISPEGGGIAWDVFGPMVYMHVKASDMGLEQSKPRLSGPNLEGTYGRYVGDDGVWSVIQAETARTYDGYPFLDRYVFDLNDSLFTRGYMIEYYFSAHDSAGHYATWPRHAGSGDYFEFTCLPTLRSDILFVDAFDGEVVPEGLAQQYLDPTFEAVLPLASRPDRYDVNSPTALTSNGLASRAKLNHLTSAYRTIIWDSGDLSRGTICDGTMASGKNNDCQMLIDWMDSSEHDCGLWICGDNIASDLNNLASPAALGLMNTWCGVSLVNGSYFEVTGGHAGGGIRVPLVIGKGDAGIFLHGGVPDSLYADGGGARIDEFDCLGKTANGRHALNYPTYNSVSYHAAIASTNINSFGFNVRTMWFGFSCMHIRDNKPVAPIDRFELARDVLMWMQNMTKPDITESVVPAAYGLAQNYPNPFNAITTVKFDMKEKGFVTIKVYNVAGELVRTLLNEVRDAGSYNVFWDGKNNLGADAASGVYFCEMKTKDFSDMKKMVLLH